MSKPTIGFVGLGIMSLPMAGHLLRAGYPMVVHERVRSTVQGSAPRET